MTQLEIFLDHWIIHRPDGSAILNGRPEDFAQVGPRAKRRLIKVLGHGPES